ncbi:MAG TPA: ATP phosphoribosyltransferase regulatory subunit [Polyangia bacterium]|nr:ATP phosphoribosyltransferase regulatory subunit [Polyangia bacterium]
MSAAFSLDGTPGDAAKWRFVRRRAFAVFQAHGYVEVRPPSIEPLGVAERSGGEPAIAVEGGELRADPMASIARLYVAAASSPSDRFARWMLAGTVYDRSPRGAARARAWQAVAGLILGASDPAGDAEIAALCGGVAADLGLVAPEVVIGSIGDAADLARYAAATAELGTLRCAACAGARDQLRFLSCEDEGCRALAASAPPLRASLGVAALKHHEAVLATLEASGFTVRDDPKLGFGAGRYNRTVVELRARVAGARGEPGELITVARGGRRDRLVESLGGRASAAVGVTLGVVRAAACTPGEGESYQPACEVFFAARGSGGRAFALRAAAAERSRGFRVDVDLRPDKEAGWADQLMRAEKVRARVVVVVGDVERKRGEVAIRDMQTRETRTIPEDTLPAELKRLLR